MKSKPIDEVLTLFRFKMAGSKIRYSRGLPDLCTVAFCNYALNIFIQQEWFDQTFVDDVESILNAMGRGEFSDEYQLLISPIRDRVREDGFHYFSYVCYREILDAVQCQHRKGSMKTPYLYLLSSLTGYCGQNADEVFSIFENIVLDGCAKSEASRK